MKFTCLLWFKSNLFNTNIFFKNGYNSCFIKFNKSLINLKLSFEVISIKNKAHWQSNKKLWIFVLSFTILSSINTSYIFKKSKSLVFNLYFKLLVIMVAIILNILNYMIL